MAYTFKKLADDWDSLTDAEKEKLFIKTGYIKPSLTQLVELNAPFKIATFDSFGDNRSVYLTAVPEDKLFIPNDLFGSTFETIDHVRASVNVSGGDVSLTHFNTGLVDVVSNTMWVQSGMGALYTSIKKFGTASLYLDGSSYIYSANEKRDFDFGDSDFSIDMWIYPVDSSDFQPLFAFSTNYHGIALGLFSNSTSNISLSCSSGGVFWDVVDDAVSEDNVISLNKWQHIALARNGQKLYVFVDGKKVIDVVIGQVSLYVDETDNFQLGAWGDATYLFNGFIDEVRISKGISHFKKAFVPNVEEYSSVLSLPKVKFAVTKDLVNYYTFNETSVIKTSTTEERDVAVVTMDGTTQRLIIPASVLSGKNQWTIEVTLSTTQTSAGDTYYNSPGLFGFRIDSGDGGNRDIIVENRNGYLSYYSGFVTSGTDKYAYTDKYIADGYKHNIALVCDGVFFRLYCDKELVAKFQSYNLTMPSHEFYVGCGYSYSSINLYEVRIWDSARPIWYLGKDIKPTAAGLKAWYLMSNVESGIVRDASVAENNGVLDNDPVITILRETVTSVVETSGFELINPFTAGVVLSDGIDSEILENISEQQWDMFFNGTEGDVGIGIAFALAQDNVNQQASVDDITMYVDMKGEWRSAHKGEDFEYGYPNNNLLRVQLLTDGDYKINYQNMVGGM